MGELASLERNIKKPGSYFQNLNIAGSSRDKTTSQPSNTNNKNLIVNATQKIKDCYY